MTVKYAAYLPNYSNYKLFLSKTNNTLHIQSLELSSGGSTVILNTTKNYFYTVGLEFNEKHLTIATLTAAYY